ncbi:MAG: hypothetical protein HY517_03575 [Candidatus Aenigmarchaeota archaeon]|nr:hypothetical protein [Candidatus Aenigmarchaeota archaeon]
MDETAEVSDISKIETSRSKEAKAGMFSFVLGVIGQKTYAKRFVIAAALFGLLYTFLYGLWRVPGIDFGINRVSEAGIVDYTYLLLITVFTGLLFALMKYERKESLESSKLAGTGGFAASIFAGVCPACQGITILAAGSTVLSLPLAFLVPYLGLLQIITILILGMAVFLKVNSVYTNTCISCNVLSAHGHGGAMGHGHIKGSVVFRSNLVLGLLTVLVVLVFLNQMFVSTVAASAGVSSGPVSLKEGFDYGPKTTLKPMPLAVGESPRIAGYRTAVKPLPTISEISLSPSTGDVAQDLVNNVVPKGTPWYGQEAGVSFDDPIAAQKLWMKGASIQLDADQQARWSRIVSSFTCDYCCGSPQNPTVLTRCGCAHSRAAQGMAKWFIKNYGDKYSDEEIYGEMGRWYAVWYPGPTVKRIIQELQAN